MPTDHIAGLIDAQIAQLQEVRAALAGIGNAPQKPAKRRGRPKGTTNKLVEASAPARLKPSRRGMTAEGKARIAAAQKARWAALKKVEEPTTPAAKKIAAKPKPARKTVAKTKRTPPQEGPPSAEAVTADV